MAVLPPVVKPFNVYECQVRTSDVALCVIK